MISKSSHIIILSLLIAPSCKKADDYGYDRESNLVLDTATYLKSARYVSHTSTSLTVEIDLVTFNGLVCETDFTDNVFVDTLSGALDISADLSNTSTAVHSPANGYSSAFVFNHNNPGWFEDNYVGFYLRRYLEQIDPDPSVFFAAIVSMDLITTGVDDVNWQNEYASSGFTNSWQHSIEAFYNITDAPIQQVLAPPSPGYGFKYAIEEILDTLIADPGVYGEKSVTLFSGPDQFNDNSEPSEAEMSVVIADAVANGVKINFVGPHINDIMVRYATETGGFTCELFNNTSGEEGDEAQIDPVSDMAVYMQNLHLILNHDVVSHRCTAVYTQTGSNTFDSGDVLQFKVLYNDEIFIYSVQIP